MPCNDITETLFLRLDAGERLAGYRLAKRTCGRAVGEESLLAAELAGRPALDILNVDLEAFVAPMELGGDEVRTFLVLKHFFAVQAGIRSLLGIEGNGTTCTVASVVCEGGDVTLEADLPIDALTEEIKACGNCKGCGALRKIFGSPREAAPR